MLSPKRVKHRKQHRGRMPGMAKGGTRVEFGEYGLKAIDRGWINNFPDKPITAKPAETRMGSGKGSPEGWVAVIKPGRVVFELAGVPEPLAKEALRLAGQKLSVKSKVVKREAELF